MRRSTDDLISVVMPVHNALPHLDAAVGSILAQSHADFEFVIYDDASTDGSTQCLREWAAKDSRIRLFEGKRKLGPAASSNRVVGQSKGSLVARMDADDIAHPERLRRQVELLAAHPNVGLVGTLCDIIDSDGRRLRGPEPWRLTRKSWFAPFAHGSILFRREIFDRVGGYRDACEFWEDQDMVLRMAAATDILVIPEPLYQHRHSPASTRLSSERERVEAAVDLMYRSMERLRRNQAYDDLLREKPARKRVYPRVFVSLGSILLWAGGRPREFRRTLRRGALGLDVQSAMALLWTGWASLAPSSLRASLTLLSRLRNAVTPRVADAPIAWSPPRLRPQRPVPNPPALRPNAESKSG